VAAAKRDRTLSAAPERIWEVIEDPHHMPRWWPGVERMEEVQEDRWTQVFMSKRGRPVRVDFRLLESEGPWRRSWAQEIPGTPFERVLREAITEVILAPVDGGTRVTIAQRQKLRGYSRTGGFLLRRANRRRLDEALEGLAQICELR
jgi:uncharacterized protein YndB with AHSA1/START domain